MLTMEELGFFIYLDEQEKKQLSQDAPDGEDIEIETQDNNQNIRYLVES